jgi:hypothetical protein
VFSFFRKNLLIILLILYLANNFKIFLRCISLSFCFFTTRMNAQVLQDSVAINLIKTGIDSIYNLQFNYSEEVSRKISKLYPDHPVAILFKEIMVFWEDYPLLPSSPGSASFEHEMRRCIRLSEENITPANEAENLLADLCARGLLLSFYSQNNLHSEVFPLAKSTYRYIRKAFDFTAVYSDLLLFTGLYNYYREAYPGEHPVYIPLAFFFPSGNRAKGLKDIQTAAENSILLKAESFSDLSYIYIGYENNYQKALYFSKYLHDLYPSNPEYLTEYIKNLLLIKRYDEAESLIPTLGGSDSNTYFKAQLSIMKGIVQEKKYYNYDLALDYYNKGIRDISVFGYYGNEFAAYAYFGLSRISGIRGEKENKRKYHKQAERLADFKKINFD